VAGVQAGQPVTKILIVDDHPVVREGLALRIARQPDLEVCGEAADITEALRLVTERRPDVAVVDIALKSGDGIDLIKRLKGRGETVRMLVWSMFSEGLYAERALRAGAIGFVTKDKPAEEILKAIRRVRDGKVHVSPTMSDRLLYRAVGGGESIKPSPIESLSDRELEAFRLTGQGLDTRQVADRMHVSPKTVETYQARIKDKLQLASSRELFQRAVQWVGETGVSPSAK
jgi:DNA-binding NarL/FixJ family response regulator